MIKWLWCKLWGHNLDENNYANHKDWEGKAIGRSMFCKRCGNFIHVCGARYVSF